MKGLSRRLGGVALVAVAILAVAPGLTSALTHFDDPLYLTLNARMARPGLDGFLNIWSPADAWNGRFLEYFPLRDTVYWVVWQGFGAEPLPYHLVSLCFHLACVLLVRRLGELLGLTGSIAWWAAAFFAVHPVHLESVVWVAGLKDPMYVSLMLAFLVLQLEARANASRRLEALSWVALTAALACKSMAVVGPLLLVLCEQTSAERPSWASTWRRALVPGAIAAAFLAHFLIIARIAHVVVPPHGGSWWAHLTLAVWAQVRYLAQAVAPADLRFIHCFEPPTPFDPRLVVGLGLLVVLGLLGWKGSRWVRWAVGFYVVCLLPVANLVPFPAVMADRYLYASSIAVCVGLALAMDALLARGGVVASALPWLVTGVWLIISFSGALDWRDEEQLYISADDDPACMTDTSNYASKAHFQRGLVAHDDATALVAFERALTAAGASKLSGPQRCGVLLQASVRAAALQGEPFVRWTDQFVAQCPGVQAAWVMGAMAALGRRPEVALSRARQAVALRPLPDAQAALGVALLDQAQDAEAQVVLDALFPDQAGEACPVLRAWVSLGGHRAESGSRWLVACAKRRP